MKRLLLLTTVLAGTVLAASTPAHAYVYSLSDEYWFKAGTAFNTVFTGASGSAATQGIYQETATGTTQTIVQMSTTTARVTGSSNNFLNAPVTGEFTQNDGGSAIVFNTWETTSFKTAGTTGALSTYQVNSVIGIPATKVQYLTGASVDSTTGAFSGTVSAFNLNSIDLSTAVGTATGYTVEGLLGGVVKYAEQICTNGNQYAVTTVGGTCGAYNETATIPFNWTDIDNFEFGFMSGSTFVTGWPSSGTLTMDNINITPFVAVAAPEPMSLAVLGAGLFGLGIIRRRSQFRV